MLCSSSWKFSHYFHNVLHSFSVIFQIFCLFFAFFAPARLCTFLTNNIKHEVFSFVKTKKQGFNLFLEDIFVENPHGGFKFNPTVFLGLRFKIVQGSVSHELTAFLPDYDLFLTHWNGHIIKKLDNLPKLDNFE